MKPPKTGVIGVLGEAALRGRLDFDETVERILERGFHVRDSLIAAM